MKLSFRAATLALFAATALRLSAQNPQLIYGLKANGYQQTSATVQNILDPSYGVIVSFAASTLASTQVQMTGPVTINLSRTTATQYVAASSFGSQAALDAALPDGSYTVSVSGGTAPSTATLAMSLRPIVPPVLITNFDELQALSSGTFRITWQPIANGTVGDIVLLTISRNGATLYSSPSTGTGALDGTSTSASLTNLAVNPGDTLSANLTYSRFDVAVANGGLTTILSSNGFNVAFPLRRAQATKPVIATQPQPLTVALGSTAALNVGATGTGLLYQWKKNGVTITGATNATYLLVNTSLAAIGNYTVDVTNSGGTTTSNVAALNVLPTAGDGRLSNLAIRSQAGTGGQTLIVGFAVGGAGTSGSKPMLVRGIGPALGAFGLTGFLADPKLEIYASSTGAKVTENDNWAGDTQVATTSTNVGAFGLGAATSKDAALFLPTLASGGYTAQVSGIGGTTGVALAELYDATAAGAFTPTTPRIINVSARTQVGTGADVLIAGFYIGGTTARTVVVRAVGPTLASFGVTGTLADPKLELFIGPNKINENDNWGGDSTLSSVFSSVGAFALSPTGKDAALVVTLAPGSYTAQVSGVGNTTGIALVEVYEVP